MAPLDFTPIRNEAARFENLVALHLLKTCHLWTELGHGDYQLFYVRDREKREVDFLITDRNKPFALIEATLSASGTDPSLRYFAERLKPRHSIQIVRHPQGFKRAYESHGVILAPAAQALTAC